MKRVACNSKVKNHLKDLISRLSSIFIVYFEHNVSITNFGRVIYVIKIYMIFLKDFHDKFLVFVQQLW